MRPSGIVLITLSNLLDALLLVFVAITLATGDGVFGAMLPTGYRIRLAEVGGVAGVAAGGFFLVFALIAALVGYGIWSFREWARMLCIVFSGVPILFSLPGLLFDFSFYRGGYPRVGYRLIRLAINVLIIWYLGQPQIKALFHKTPRTPQV